MHSRMEVHIEYENPCQDEDANIHQLLSQFLKNVLDVSIPIFQVLIPISVNGTKKDFSRNVFLSDLEVEQVLIKPSNS